MLTNQLTANRIVLWMQTLFIVLTVYNGGTGILAYGAEKMAIAVFCSFCGLLLFPRVVKPNRSFGGMKVWAILIFALILFSYYTSYSRVATQPYLLRFAFLLAWMFLSFDVGYLENVCKYLKNVGLVIALAYLVTYPFMGVNAGIFQDFQFTGQLVCIATLFVIPDLFMDKGQFKKNLIWFGVLMLALMLTGKRMLTAIPVVLVLLVFLLSKDNKKIRKMAGIVILSASFLGIGMLCFPQILNTINRIIEGAGDSTLTSRTYFWDYAMMLWEQNPVFGIGFGAYPTHILTGGVNLGNYGYIQAFAAHNIYYQLLAETGTVGLCLFVGMFLTSLFTGYRTLRLAQKRNDPTLVRLVFIGLCCQTWFLIYGLTGNPLYMPGQDFVYFLGVMIVISTRRKMKETANSAPQFLHLLHSEEQV